MPYVQPGQRSWEMTRDENGNRTYKIKFLVEMDSPLQGPSTALFLTPGLPLFGSLWLIDADVDLWAWCRWDAEVKPLVENEPNTDFEITYTFSSTPPKSEDKGGRACNETQFEDPLLEPAQVSGSFVVYNEEATYDRFGIPIVNSAWERLRGPQVEFDGNRPQVKISMNVSQLNLALLSSMCNTVNEFSLWGLPPRCIKLSGVEWERRWWGTCFVYYTWHLTFDIRFDTFDRYILDEGTKVLNGQWDTTTGNWDLVNINGSPPDHTNPKHFIKFTDRLGNPMKGVLNGAGLPAGVDVSFGSVVIGGSDAGYIYVQKYLQSDFTLLGIPLTF